MTQNKLPKKNKFFKAKKLDSLILTQQSVFSAEHKNEDGHS